MVWAQSQESTQRQKGRVGYRRLSSDLCMTLPCYMHLCTYKHLIKTLVLLKGRWHMVSNRRLICRITSITLWKHRSSKRLLDYMGIINIKTFKKICLPGGMVLLIWKKKTPIGMQCTYLLVLKLLQFRICELSAHSFLYLYHTDKIILTVIVLVSYFCIILHLRRVMNSF